MEEEILYKYGRYVVQVIEDHHEDGMKMSGYGVINTETSVTEYTTTLFFHACKWARVCEQEASKYEAITDEDDDVISWPNPDQLK